MGSAMESLDVLRQRHQDQDPFPISFHQLLRGDMQFIQRKKETVDEFKKDQLASEHQVSPIMSVCRLNEMNNVVSCVLRTGCIVDFNAPTSADIRRTYTC